MKTWVLDRKADIFSEPEFVSGGWPCKERKGRRNPQWPTLRGRDSRGLSPEAIPSEMCTVILP